MVSYNHDGKRKCRWSEWFKHRGKWARICIGFGDGTPMCDRIEYRNTKPKQGYTLLDQYRYMVGKR